MYAGWQEHGESILALPWLVWGQGEVRESTVAEVCLGE